MKNKHYMVRLIFAIFFVMGVSIEATLASSCKMYKDTNFEDREINIYRNEKLSSLGRKMNNETSSVRVPRGCKLVVFSDTDFRGEKRIYQQSTSFVGQRFNDKISSAKCKCAKGNNHNDNGGYNGGGGNWNNNNNNNNNKHKQCVVFQDTEFRGRKLKIGKNEKLAYVGDRMNDQISSVRVPNGCKLVTFDDTDFRGKKRIYQWDSQFIGDRHNDRISSLKCRCEGGNGNNWNGDNGNIWNGGNGNNWNGGNGNNWNGGNAGNGRKGNKECRVYDDYDFRGRQFSIGRNQNRAYVGDRMNNRISSIKVPSNCKLMAYRDTDFRGPSTSFRTQNALDKRWNDKISSLRCICR